MKNYSEEKDGVSYNSTNNIRISGVSDKKVTTKRSTTKRSRQNGQRQKGLPTKWSATKRSPDKMVSDKKVSRQKGQRQKGLQNLNLFYYSFSLTFFKNFFILYFNSKKQNHSQSQA